jgi:dTMP kinase
MTRFDARDRNEGEPLDFRVRVREAFLALAARDPQHYLVLDARDGVDAIAEQVRKRVQELLP